MLRFVGMIVLLLRMTPWVCGGGDTEARLLSTLSTSTGGASGSAMTAVQAQENNEGRFHPNKGAIHKADEQSLETIAEAAFSFGEWNTDSDNQRTTTTEASISSMPLHNDSEDEDIVNATTAEPYSYDEDNLVEVSISLALPETWNLTSSEDEYAVYSLVEDASRAATQLFRSTLDHAITIIDASPQTLLHGVAKEAEDSSSLKPPRPSQQQYYSDLNVTGTLDDMGSWSLNNWTDWDDDAEILNNNNSTNSSFHKETSETILWDWLGMVPLSKEELYKMVLDYLEIESEDDWLNATEASPLLRSLKAEVRNDIHEFFFQEQQRKAEYYNTTGKEANSSDTPLSWWDAQFFNTNYSSSDWMMSPDDANSYYTPKGNDYNHYQQFGQGEDEESNQLLAAGMWEMFLADTRVELVRVEDTYAWWKLTMIYPVYIHYQPPDVTTVVETTSVNLDEGSDAAAAPVVSYFGTNETSSTATETPVVAYLPVTDTGTLEFINRLLRRVLEAAVLSGAFLSSLENLQGSHSPFAAQIEGAGNNIVDDILGLTMPGMEHEVEEWISPYEDDAMAMAARPKEVNVTPPQQPWETGTFTKSLNSSRDSKRHQVGVVLLIATGVWAGVMILFAHLRNLSQKRTMEKVFLLGTEQDVTKLLHVGWRQYEVPAAATDCSKVSGDKAAEIIEVFDKSQEGYCDNDSMLHGSAMQQSCMYDSASEVPSVPMEYEKHLERHRGRGEDDMFKALEEGDKG